MTKSPTPEYYQRRVGGVLLDPYRIARVYGMTDDALFSALKKILAAGKRGAKDKAKDVQDAIDALVRWQEMEAEDNADSRVAAMDAADSHDTSVVPLVLDIATILEFREGNHVVDEAARVAAHIAELEALVQSVTSALPPQVLDDVPLALPDRVANLVDDLRTARRRIAELERARDDARTLLQNARDQRDSYRDTLDTERQAAAATAEELERVRKELGAQSQRAADAEAAFRKERTRADALHGELSTARHDLTAGIAAVQALIHDSDGVAGLHLNGEVAPWRDLLEGGNLEAWLIAFSRAVRLAEVDGEHPA